MEVAERRHPAVLLARCQPAVTGRGQDNVVLVVSIPASELEISVDDHSDHERFKHLLNRLGKAIDRKGSH